MDIHKMAKKKVKKKITGLQNQSKSPSYIEETLVDTAKTIKTSSIHPMTQIYADIKEQSDNSEG
jgi:hypothetical protein